MDTFGGRIRGQFNYGDVLKYQFAINERSALSLRGMSPIYEMNLGFEGFEFGLDAWQTKPGGWGLEKQRVRTGQNAIHESPGQGVNYPADAEVIITLREGLDLSRLSQATLSLWHFFAFGEGDYGYVEASRDSGQTWSALSEPLTGSVLKYYQAEFSLDELTGPGNDNVLLRFRLRSDASINGPGWFIDDISILPIRTAVGREEEMIPDEVMLFDAYPNPFNAQTQFQYSLPVEMTIRLSIMNTLGQEVAVIENGVTPAGVHTIRWDGRDRLGHAAPTGLYFYRLQTPNGPMVKKLTLLR
ncbi:MAG: T9SS C-terminal target domain-containing protein [Calditrichaeota bacterium]|nr:MAG: T9SS C-terminal target domain-containing protein [Calditrichota bacterium]